MRHIYSFIIFTGIITILIASCNLIKPVINENSLSNAYSKWESQNIDSYEMTLVAIALPAPPAALHLIVQNNVIVDETIIACEQPSDEYPTNLCEPTRTYYAYMARHTIEEIFESAEQCLSNTQLALQDCPYISSEFESFQSREEMYQIAESCQGYINNLSQWLCAVQYDDIYGYPKEISSYLPNALDGFGMLIVKDFQAND